ncbi:hypothetical protein [Geobacter sp. DSM 9736]|nr:hypothetical protein [Geobacter sp. DSM 9736]SNB47711.1 hypothetical protein SAMN06269301_3203 [Geobacter sp. DSM 9736]
MTDKMTELEELEREIRKIIDDNKKFLSRVLDDDFEPEEEEPAEEPEVEI